MSDREALREIKATLDAAKRATGGDDARTLGALVGAISTFCAQRAKPGLAFDLVLDTLTRAKGELETGLPLLDITRGPAS